MAVQAIDYHQARFDPTVVPFDVLQESLDMALIFDPVDRYLAFTYLKTFRDYFTRARNFSTIDWQDQMIAKLALENLIGLVAFRSSGKSEFLAESFIAYYIMAFPYSLIGVFSESAPMSRTRLRNIKRQIVGQRGVIRNGKKNPFANFYKHNTEWNKESIVLPNGSRVEVAGSATGVRGGREGDERYNIIIVDDPVPEQMGKDEAILKWFRESVANLGQAGTIIILIGTPRRYGDIIVDLLENAEKMGMSLIYIKVAEQYPPITMDQIAWPSRWTFEASCCHKLDSSCSLEFDPFTRALAHMEAHKNFIGSLAWFREYMCEPIADGTALFPQSLLAKSFDYDLAMGEFMSPSSIRVLGVDPAVSEEAGFIVLEIDTEVKDYEHYTGYRGNILHSEHLNGKNYPDDFQKVQLETIIRLKDQYNVVAIGIEDNGYQATYKNLLKALRINLPIHLITTTAEKHSWEVGLPSVRQWFENGFLSIPQKNEENTLERMGRLILELRGFQFEGGKVLYNGVAHGDLPMALLKAKEVYHIYKGKGIKMIGSMDQITQIQERRNEYYG